MGRVRIGVFGGTFNPIHRGHLHIARMVQSLFSLSQIHFVVASTPPHKHPEDLVPFAHRYAMVSLAVAGKRSYMPSPIELEPEYSPYTVDTLSKLERSIGRHRARLFFIAGGDSLLEVKTWKDSEKLLTSYDFIFVQRPGIPVAKAVAQLPASVIPRVHDWTNLRREQIRHRVADLGAGDSGIHIVDVGAPDISSTGIRARASSDRAIRRMVPGPVREYIRKLHLYGGQ